MKRRDFLAMAALAGLAKGFPGEPLAAAEMIGPIRKEDGSAPVDGPRWYVAEAEGAGVAHRFPRGALAKAKYIAADMLLAGDTLATFSLALQEGEKGRVFQYCFGGLNQCSFRVRMALDLVNQNRFFVDREGGLLKPMSWAIASIWSRWIA